MINEHELIQQLQKDKDFYDTESKHFWNKAKEANSRDTYYRLYREYEIRSIEIDNVIKIILKMEKIKQPVKETLKEKKLTIHYRVFKDDLFTKEHIHWTDNEKIARELSFEQVIKVDNYNEFADYLGRNHNLDNEMIKNIRSRDNNVI